MSERYDPGPPFPDRPATTVNLRPAKALSPRARNVSARPDTLRAVGAQAPPFEGEGESATPMRVQPQVRDAETYLREKGEELLLGGDDVPWAFQRLPRIARILEVAGALDPAVGAKVLEEYLTAFRLRGQGRFWTTPVTTPAAVPLTQSRVVAGSWEVKGGPAPVVVELVQFATDGFSFNAHGFIPPGHQTRRGSGLGQSPVPASFTVADVTGTTVVTTGGRGHWSDRYWGSTFESSTPLDPATPWIEVDGQRIDLPSPPALTAKTWVEDLSADEDPLRAELRWALARDATEPRGPGMRELEEAVEALVATGARRDDDPAVEEARQVWSAVSRNRRRSGGRRGTLPPPWSAWQRRRTRTDGPVGQLPVGAYVEDLEGCNLRFDVLHSHQDGFSLQLAASPGTVILGHGPVSDRELLFWAEDERGNVYLGLPGSNGGSHEMVEGLLEFTGPLDPNARRLRLLPTGRKRRGVVEIPLDGLTANR